MTALIENIIPASNFEIVQNKIGVILLSELTNQKTKKCFKNDFEVYIDRQTPYSEAEDVMINVVLNGANYSGKTQIDSQGMTTYFVDVYCNSNETDCLTGSENSRLTIMQFVGLIRYILSSTKYKTLGFEAGFIGGTMIDSIQFPDNFGNQEASFMRFARLTFSARLQESQLAWEGVPLLGNDTTIKLDSTEKGYKLIFNN